MDCPFDQQADLDGCLFSCVLSAACESFCERKLLGRRERGPDQLGVLGAGE